MSDDGFERVHVELEWYDGPRAAIADVLGVPHRFKSNFDEQDDEWLGTYRVWPVDAEVVAFEMEQWRIFVAWNRRYESGQAVLDTHPAYGGIDARWDELDRLLERSRTSMPMDARLAKAEFRRLEQGERYADCGPDYALRWILL